MDLSEPIRWMAAYDLWLIIIGLGILGAAVLPHILQGRPLAMPMVVFAIGFLAIALPIGLTAPDPLHHGHLTERLTELGVIIALMSAGLRIDRPPGFKRWSSTARLLGITMVLTIALAALAGWTIAAFVPATAALFGAVLAPTDPVLASQVQVGAPRQGFGGNEEEDEVPFALTSEAGLNDGLAFPFTNLAIAMAIAGTHPANWIEAWLLVDVLFKTGVAIILGLGLGWLLGAFLLTVPPTTATGRMMTGLGSIAATLLIYGATQYAGGYGFIAVFIGAVMIRRHDRGHPQHDALFLAADHAERYLVVLILIGLGGAIADGLLAPLDVRLAATAFLVVFIIRPLAGILGLLGAKKISWRERFFISFFGIRGIGSIYYLAYAFNHASFPGEREVWAVVALAIAISILIHGTMAGPLTQRLKTLRQREQKEARSTAG